MLEALAEMMIPVYVSLVKAGRKTREQVPENIRERVTVMLDAMEAVTNE